MDRDLASITGRLKWAMRHSGKTQHEIAQEMEVSDPVLSQWIKRDETIARAKVRNVMAFCTATGVNLHWLMTGEGPALARYPSGTHPLITEATHIVHDMPAVAETGYRVLKALKAGGSS